MEDEPHIREWLSDYALGCLEGHEKAVVEAHLAHCETCRVELREYQAVVAQLSLAAPEYAPPAHLKQAILQNSVKPPVDTKDTRLRSVRPKWFQRLRLWLGFPVPAWGLVGLALVAVILFASTVLLYQQNQQYALNRVNEFQVVDLSGASGAPQATGWIVISHDGFSGTLIVQGLPTLPSGHQYQLWLVQGGKRVSGAVFSVNAYGYASVWVKSSAPLIQFNQFGITIEPSGGSTAPTGPKVLGGNL
jgi:anti-sigma-K factor RskA